MAVNDQSTSTTPLTDGTDGSTNKNDTITGSLVDDYIDAGNGNDFVFGNQGADTLLGGNGADQVFGGEGSDLIGVANLDSALRNGGSGDNAGDYLYGDGYNTHSQYLLGAGGLPSVGVTTTNAQLGIGHDTIFGGNGKDVIYGDSGHASTAIYGGNDVILAGNGVDTVYGEGGNDVIVGENGHDILSGGVGNDYFVYNAHNESSGTGDTITDFSGVKDLSLDNDKIDLRAFLGDSNHVFTGAGDYVAANNDANQLNWGGTTPTVNGVWYAHVGGNTVVYADTNGDGAADLTIKLLGIKDLTNNDFYGVKNADVTIDPSDTTGAATEIADNDTGENVDDHTETGTINFSDPDFGSVHTASFTEQDSGYVGTFSLGTVDDVGTDVDWTYTVNDSALDFLADGEILEQKYDVTIDDGAGGTATITITVTITGTNDAPIIDSAAQSGAITETADSAPAVDADPADATGTITFDDVDLADEPTASITASSVTGGTASLTPAQQAALLDNLSLSAVTDNPDGSGSVDWTYAVPNSEIDFLGAGKTVELTFTVEVDDQEGGTATQDVVITITGTNDAATIAGTLTGDVTEDSGTYTASAAITVSDVDQGENELDPDVGTTAHGSYEVTTGGWSYEADNSLLQYLGAGDTATDTFTITSEDGTDSETVEVTLHGVNDAATITGDSIGTVVEATSGNPGTPSDTGDLDVADVDAGEAIFQAVLMATASANGYGTYTVTAAGVWTYTLDNTNPIVNALNNGGSLADSFTVLSQDGTAQVVSITIHGATDNEAPTDLTLSNNTIQETSLNNTVVGTLSTTDPDNVSGFSYTLIDNAGGRFKVDVSTGVVSLARTDLIDFEFDSSHDIVVQVVDLGGASYTETFSINVTNFTGTTATNGADVIDGTSANNSFDGAGGDDRIFGGEGNDTLLGGNGEDALYGQGGDDTLNGEQNNDFVVDGGAGNDILNGGNNNDRLIGGTGADTMDGGNGDDRFIWRAEDLGTGLDQINSFGTGAAAGNDILQIGDVMTGYSGGSTAGFVQVINSGGNALVQVDANGGGNSWTTLVQVNSTSVAAVTAALDVSTYVRDQYVG